MQYVIGGYIHTNLVYKYNAIAILFDFELSSGLSRPPLLFPEQCAGAHGLFL